MVGKDDPGVDAEGRVEPHLPTARQFASPTGLEKGGMLFAFPPLRLLLQLR
jgi:hypothetical protein